jgi:hypothetical protein
LRFKRIVGVVNVYTMVLPCHKIAAALGELYLLGDDLFARNCHSTLGYVNIRTFGCNKKKENGNCQNKIDTFLQFVLSVKPSYER